MMPGGIIEYFSKHFLTLNLLMDFNKYKEQFIASFLPEEYNQEEIKLLLSYAEELYNQGLPIIYDQVHFSKLVGYDYRYLLSISNLQPFFYKEFNIPKKNGGVRTIMEPYPSLKEIQFWILKHILEPAASEHVSPVAKAFIPGISLRGNARFHKGKQCVIALDLHDFFGSVTYNSIYAIFKKLKYSKSVSTLLANLCTCNGCLPQGSPTSPMLSNFVFKRLDDKIFGYCRKNGILYTRYADDMTFSSNQLSPRRLISYIKMLIASHGFKLNGKKTKVMGRGMRQEVTGVVVNEKMQVNRLYRDKIRQELFFCIKFGFDNHISHMRNLPPWIKTTRHYINHLYGKVNFVLLINPRDNEFLQYKNWLKGYMDN